MPFEVQPTLSSVKSGKTSAMKRVFTPKPAMCADMQTELSQLNTGWSLAGQPYTVAVLLLLVASPYPSPSPYLLLLPSCESGGRKPGGVGAAEGGCGTQSLGSHDTVQTTTNCFPYISLLEADTRKFWFSSSA